MDKIDSNGIYGCLGQHTALIYNSNVATSITSQGRASVSSMSLHFEMFLADNVKFGSLEELVEFVNHIVHEEDEWHFNDDEILEHIPTAEECFAKLVLECGYRWVPDDNELDIIWKIVNNLSVHHRTRVYYKNNLYEFASNPYVLNLVKGMIHKLERPFYTSVDVPPEISDDLKHFKDLCFEYVYYHYMFIDRIDRTDNMMKSVVMVSDTDSTIISIDAWYRFIAKQLEGEDIRIADYSPDPVIFDSKDEFGDWKNPAWRNPISFLEEEYDYDFRTEKVIKKGFKFKEPEEEENFKTNNPDMLTPNDNIRYSLISIMCYVLDRTVNDYMIRMCQNQYSVKEPFHTPKDCRVYAKNEFLFKRLMLVSHAKKNYASIMEVQEGNKVPESKQLDVKGIEAIHKSSKPLSTRKALKKILLEDILKAPVIDQLKFIKDINIFEKKMVESIRKGNKEYFKPATIKAMNAYDDPLRIQGIKASIAWNMLRESIDPAIPLDERNAIYIVKTSIDRNTAEDIKDTYPEIYEHIMNALDDETFKTYVKDPKTGEKTKLSSNSIDAVALPLDTSLPDWLAGFVNYDSIIADNLNGFPYESIGIERLGRNSVNQTNIVKL